MSQKKKKKKRCPQSYLKDQQHSPQDWAQSTLYLSTQHWPGEIYEFLVLQKDHRKEVVHWKPAGSTSSSWQLLTFSSHPSTPSGSQPEHKFFCLRLYQLPPPGAPKQPRDTVKDIDIWQTKKINGRKSCSSWLNPSSGDEERKKHSH